MRLTLRIVFGICFVLAISVGTAWAALALWYRLPTQELVRGVAAALFVLLGLATIIALGRLRLGSGLAVVMAFVMAFAAVLIWWSTILPADEADWAPDVARQVPLKLHATVASPVSYILSRMTPAPDPSPTSRS